VQARVPYAVMKISVANLNGANSVRRCMASDRPIDERADQWRIGR
jgi:hypothetical protein